MTGLMEQRGALSAGKAFGRYMVLNELGEGGMARVWLAFDLQRGTPCALKEARRFLDPDMDGAATRCLFDEANLLSRLNHPAIPRMVDLLADDRGIVLAIESFEGVPLATLCNGRVEPFEPAQVIAWALQLCDVLGYLHRQTPSVIYRDLKPGNILLSGAGVIRLVDFGIACCQGSASASRVLGTGGYAAPEQLDGLGPIDARADVYALGATMHRLLTMHAPRSDGAPPRPLRQCRRGLSSELEHVVSTCLSPKPDGRYAGCSEVRNALEACPEALGRLGGGGVA